MNTSTATTTAADITRSAAPYTSAEPLYQHVGDGRFRPVNTAAWREVNAWNEYAAMITARSAAARESAVQ